MVVEVTRELKRMNQLVRDINRLKKEKNAIILVHNYQRPEIYEVADLLGDSLELAKKAAETDKDIIVFCGVHFMAETAKMLNPKKKVLLPEIDAGCPMADMVKPGDVESLRKKYPKAAVACYINTTAATKALCDICVTSANAVKVINSLEEDEVIFLPDKNLAKYVAKNTKKKIIPFDGFCHVHHTFQLSRLKIAKEQHPEAEVIAHPECPEEILNEADYITSTSGMIIASRESKAKELLIATELGMIERLKREVPGKTFYSAGSIRVCPNMKKTFLESVYNALKEEKYEIKVSKEIADKAIKCVDRMLKVK